MDLLLPQSRHVMASALRYFCVERLRSQDLFVLDKLKGVNRAVLVQRKENRPKGRLKR